ncbi:hypothetical protein CYMTET_45627, partial [Cymbomonas tetramitiformis]
MRVEGESEPPRQTGAEAVRVPMNNAEIKNAHSRRGSSLLNQHVNSEKNLIKPAVGRNLWGTAHALNRQPALSEPAGGSAVCAVPVAARDPIRFRPALVLALLARPPVSASLRRKFRASGWHQLNPRRLESAPCNLKSQRRSAALWVGLFACARVGSFLRHTLELAGPRSIAATAKRSASRVVLSSDEYLCERRALLAQAFAAAATPQPALPQVTSSHDHWEGLNEWRARGTDLRLGFGAHGPEPLPDAEGVHRELPADSLAGCGRAVLLTETPLEKAILTHATFAAFLEGRLTIGSAAAPDRPSRPANPVMVPAREVPHFKDSPLPLNAYLLHNLAHIELNAIDLAWDTVVRYSTLHPTLP